MLVLIPTQVRMQGRASGLSQQGHVLTGTLPPLTPRALHGNRQAALCHEKAPGEQRNRAACTWMGPLVVTWGSLAAATLGSVPEQQHGLGHNPFPGCCYPKSCCHD